MAMLRWASHLLIAADIVAISAVQVLARANATDYGLAAGVFTEHLATANTLSKGLQAGTVWVNCW